MATIAYADVVEAVRQLAVDTAFKLPADVRRAIESAIKSESSPKGREYLELILENDRLAEREKLPLCQDTGLAVVFVDQGNQVQVAAPVDRAEATLSDAINEGIEAGYDKAYLRKSVVAEPLEKRRNTGTNTPTIIHHRWVAGSELTISLLAKGGGAENKSKLTMLKPCDGREGVVDFVVETVSAAGADACPPFVVGVGIGGNFETVGLLAKRALLRELGSGHADGYYSEMESELLSKINALKIGPQGMGGDTTALAVLIETAPCHIASLPLAVNIECHSHRHRSITLGGSEDG